MNSNAVYTVIDGGRETYFLSRIAGGYSYPFNIFEYVNRMAAVINENAPMGKVGYAEILPLLKADENFPDNVRGDSLFRRTEDNIAARKLDEFTEYDDNAFGITLDFDNKKIGFVFNRNCHGLDLPDMEICLNSKNIMEYFDKTDFVYDPELSKPENEERFYKAALEKAYEKIQTFDKDMVQESSMDICM